MENSSDEQNLIKEPLLSSPKKGGLRTLPFIIANEAFEKVASVGLTPNMTIYLMGAYNMEMTTVSNILFIWNAANNFTVVVGAYLADSVVGRFRMIGFGSLFSLLCKDLRDGLWNNSPHLLVQLCTMLGATLTCWGQIGLLFVDVYGGNFILKGMILLWLTTMIPEATPPPCDQSNGNCKFPNSSQLILLCSSFGLMSIGAGGIRSCSLAFGADQLQKKESSKKEAALERYFSWYYASSAISVLVAMTCIVYIQDNIGWKVGFGVPVVLMFFSALSFLLASPFYIKLKAETCLLTGFLQVIVASYRNRHQTLSSKSNNVCYHQNYGSMLVVPSDKLRFLNTACVIRDPDQENLLPYEKASNSWKLCTIDQVEELKAIIKVIPLWSSGIMVSLVMAQNSFSIVQTKSMDRHVTPNFEIPAGSFGMFTILSITLWVTLYDHVILPIASRIAGKPVHLSPKQKMGFGLSLSFMSMVVTAIVESVRRENAIKELSMSAIWTIPQHGLNGVADAMIIIGQNELYYLEFPKSMSIISCILFGVGSSVASLLASFLITLVDYITKKGGNESWVSSNINKGHYDYYYLVLAGLSLVNIGYFYICSRAYGRPKGEEKRVLDEEHKVRDS